MLFVLIFDVSQVLGLCYFRRPCLVCVGSLESLGGALFGLFKAGR
jgi:hypothetical protein